MHRPSNEINHDNRQAIHDTRSTPLPSRGHRHRKAPSSIEHETVFVHDTPLKRGILVIAYSMSLACHPRLATASDLSSYNSRFIGAIAAETHLPSSVLSST